MSHRSVTDNSVNTFLTLPVGRLFLRTALPMAVVMSTGGLLSVVDGIFVGRFVGPDALAAVSLSFPMVMLLTALSTLVGGGMASLAARHLGARDKGLAGRAFASAHGLALALSAGIWLLAWLLGPVLLPLLAGGNTTLVAPARAYLAILILGAPLQLALSIHADLLRSEGRAGVIALLSVLVNLLNIGANALFIVQLDMGVAGSALGTVLAQGLGVALLLGVRARDPALVPLGALTRESWRAGWGRMLALGLPLCLSFIGMALVSGVVLLRLAGSDPALIAAYGVATRLLGFAFLPLMAIALTVQSISGNNAGAGQMARARAGLRLGAVAAGLWCLLVMALGAFGGEALGALFSDAPGVAQSLAAILRVMTALYVVSGPVLVLAMHYQALGQPGRTAMLTLVKPWLLTPALILTLSAAFGTQALWLAFPLADALVALMALVIVTRPNRIGELA
ncbi:MATE family efflux transporter [Rhodobacter sp. NTK016B]|uniref:MATE family efflux transporter n=1 Tax=Rhodobacter sp. NTK016B TaxID=2759676 RepID=UPI0025713052|nr:MATE family efflux transporter [Rhodobacter sp. NTK016B]